MVPDRNRNLPTFSLLPLSVSTGTDLPVIHRLDRLYLCLFGDRRVNIPPKLHTQPRLFSGQSVPLGAGRMILIGPPHGARVEPNAEE